MHIIGRNNMTEITDPFDLKDEFEEEDDQNFAFIFHELNRAYVRIIKSLIYQNDRTGLWDNYKSVLLQEKEILLNILIKQQNYLMEIKSPKHLIEQKMSEIKIVKDAIVDIKKVHPKILLFQLRNRLDEILLNDLKLLTTDFVTNSWTTEYTKSLDDILIDKYYLYRT